MHRRPIWRSGCGFCSSAARTDQGVQLLSAQVLAQMTTPRVHAGNAGVEEVGDLHYGLGLMVQHYRGERTVSHSGSWLGWGTSMTLLPARGIGIAVLTNRAPSAVPLVLTSSVLDRLCSQAPIDWFGRFQTLRQQLLSQQATDAQAKRELRRPDTQPSHALAEYAGDYEHPAYGRMQIAHRDGKLDWRWRDLSAELAHRHYDIFTLPDKPAEFFPDGLNLTFGYDRDGTIDRVEAPLEPTVAEVVFRRVASGDVLDLAFRERCTGTFMHGVQQIDIALDATGQLTMAVTGQPTYRLLPFHDRTFELEGAPRLPRRVSLRAAPGCRRDRAAAAERGVHRRAAKRKLKLCRRQALPLGLRFRTTALLDHSEATPFETRSRH